MKYIKSGNIEWQKEPTYSRGVMFPYGNEIDPGLQVQQNLFEPGTTVGNHKHPAQTEIIYGLEGELKIIFNDETVNLGPGDLVIIEAGDEHGAANDDAVKARILTVKINGSVDDTKWLGTE